MTLTWDTVHDNAFTVKPLCLVCIPSCSCFDTSLSEIDKSKISVSKCVFRLGEHDQINMAIKPTCANVSK